MGSLAVPDPNRFGGEVEFFAPGGTWQAIPLTHGYAEDNCRILGLVDMAVAINQGRSHRASGELAFHVLEVMEALVGSSPLMCRMSGSGSAIFALYRSTKDRDDAQATVPPKLGRVIPFATA